MYFIDFKKPGSADVLFLNEQPIPEPRSGEILVKVKAAGVNRADIYQREGNYPPPKGASPILGLEIAGVVSKVGPDVKRWRVGDAVCSLTNGGGYAEYCTVLESESLPVPEGLNFIEAASLPEAYFTVWGNLFMRTTLRSNELILIHGGSSGIGSCAIQLAKAFGAKVATTVGNKEKEAFVKNLNADIVINYKENDFLDILKNTKVDVVLDIVGGDYFEKNLQLLKEDGRLVQVSLMGGALVTFDLKQLLFKRLTIVGSTLRAQPAQARGLITEELLLKVWPLFEKKLLKPVVTATFPLPDAKLAHRLMESSQHCGKIILVVAD